MRFDRATRMFAALMVTSLAAPSAFSGEPSVKITYHVGQHDGGYAYRLDHVWSEPFATHQQALTAAKAAAQRQHIEGRDAEITYQTADGSWRSEHALGGDRPETAVVDDG